MILVIVIFIILVISIIRATLFIDQVCDLCDLCFLQADCIYLTHFTAVSLPDIKYLLKGYKELNVSAVYIMKLMVKKSNGKYLHHLFRQWMKKKDIIMSRNKNTKYVYFKF